MMNAMNRLYFKPAMLVAGVFLMAGGCRSVQSASYGSAIGSEVLARRSSPTTELDEARSPSRWPSRWGNNPDQRGTIIEYKGFFSLSGLHLSRHHQQRSSEIEYHDINALAAELGMETGFKFKPEGAGSYIFRQRTSTGESTSTKQKSSILSKSPDLVFKFVSATPESIDSNAVEPVEDHVLLQRTWFTFRDPKKKQSDPDGVKESLGTIVLLPGMFGTPEPIVNALELYFQSKGYSVLRMLSHPSRFTEHEKIKVVMGEEIGAAQYAAVINDDRVAEGAYATKSAMDHLFSKRPGLEEKPVILMGMSGGAMMLPTVYAYSPKTYSGAVLIAGGADFLTIAIESNYKSWIDAIVFDFKEDTDRPRLTTDMGEPTDEQLATLSQAYLLSSKLDAYHTATEMGEVPVLMLHASVDRAVPASTGELLYQQLGQPERWSYPIGHELIFAGLPMQVVRINKWITEHVIEAQ